MDISKVERFLQFFKDVGADRNDLAEIFDFEEEFTITYYDLAYPENLAKKITPELIKWCSNVFGVSKNWLCAPRNPSLNKNRGGYALQWMREGPSQRDYRITLQTA
jgi:hypothetical protein